MCTSDNFLITVNGSIFTPPCWQTLDSLSVVEYDYVHEITHIHHFIQVKETGGGSNEWDLFRSPAICVDGPAGTCSSLSSEHAQWEFLKFCNKTWPWTEG